MYDDYSPTESTMAEAVDDREQMVAEFVRLDHELAALRKDRKRIDEQHEKATAKQNDLRNRLRDALGLDNSDMIAKSLNVEAFR